jgi:hypothetical protein
MHTATGGPLMIFFFTVVTVILPALVLAGIVFFAARDAVEDRREREVQGSAFAVPSVALAKEGSSSVQVQRARSPHTPRRIFAFLSAKPGKCS